MKGAVGSNSFTLKFENFTWRSGKVKALQSDSPTLRTAIRNSFKLDSSAWTDRFRNEDGSMWVDDGQTVPVAFGDNFLIEIDYAVGGTPYTFNYIIVDKTTFIQASKEISEGIFIQSGVTDDWGMDVYYGGSLLYTVFNVYEDSVGIIWGTFEIQTTSTFASLSKFNEEVLDSGTVGDITNTVVDVVIVGGNTYEQQSTSQSGNPLLISEITVVASNGLQALAPIEIKRSDVNGNEYVYYQIPTIDPYQFQNVVKLNTDFLMDFKSFIEVSLEGDSTTRITMDYGDLEYEPLSDVDLDELITFESEELELVYSNFGGFEVEYKKDNNLAWIVVAILTMLYITK